MPERKQQILLDSFKPTPKYLQSGLNHIFSSKTFFDQKRMSALPGPFVGKTPKLHVLLTTYLGRTRALERKR